MIRRPRMYGAVGLIAVAAVVFTTTAVHALVWTPEREVLPSAAIQAAARAHAVPKDFEPHEVLIPTLSIDAMVENLGVTTGDRMAMPSSFSTVGWYKYGPVPGTSGTAVMYGHLDNGLGLSGVFKHLSELKPGDQIEVITNNGTKLHFKVDRLEFYQYQNVPAAALGRGSEDGASHVHFITCAGGWTYDRDMGMTYDHRLVVYTSLQY